MTVDVPAALAFMARHARVLDRRRLDLLLGAADASAALAAVDGYRNADGGYGWGLEPDLRSPESQPGGALHAFEVFAEALPTTTFRSHELCDWLLSVTLEDGGLPFALPVTDPAGDAPFWAQADATTSSLQITSLVAGAAQRVADGDARVASHAWLQRATRFCLDRLAQLDAVPHALEMIGALALLDAIHDREPDASGLLARLGGFLPATGQLHVEGGQPDEAVRALDFAPYPDRPVRGLFTAAVISAELDRLESTQQSDGGWTTDFTSYSPAAVLEWRGYQTVRNFTILRRNRRI